nr:porin family protein [uncultured Carboxylicivirga sp.]
MKVRRAITIFLLFLNLNSFGQSYFGLTGGVNFSNVFLSSNNNEPLVNTNTLGGFNFGFLISAKLNNSINIRPELQFSQKGMKFEEIQDEYEYTGKERLNYLNVPLLVEIKPGGENSIISILAGPYISIGIGGSYEIQEISDNKAITYKGKIEYAKEINQQNITEFSQGATVINQFDYGFDFGLGFNIKKVSINFIQEFGAKNIEPIVSSKSQYDFSRSNRNTRISLVYNFTK